MAGEDTADDLVELRPAPSVLLRHRADADVVVHAANRVGPRVDLRRGALWVRAGEDGPGVTVTHGAANVQVRAGAGVIEVSDLEAILVVASGRAAVKGAAPLPRSVLAGQAVALTLDGTFTDPAVLTAAELASDRMVVENLARDSLLSAGAGARSAPPVAPPPPLDVLALQDLDGFVEEPLVEEPPGLPVEEPPVLPEPAPALEPVPAPDPGPDAAPGPLAGPAPGPAASALESALAGVGVTDDPAAERVAVDAPVAGDEEAAAAAPEGDRRRTRVLVALVILALLVFALVALLVLGGSGS